MSTPPRPDQVVHPFADPAHTGACAQATAAGACGQGADHPCHAWPFRTLPAPAGDRVAALEDLLDSVFLYVHWRYVTRQLTTEQKDLWADVIDAARVDRDAADGYTGTDMASGPVERWWRD